MASTLRDDLLPVVDEMRQIPDDLGLRRYSVFFRVRTWSGGKPGLGDPKDVDTYIVPKPKVRQLSTKEVAESAGTYEAGDYMIDKITPRFVDEVTGVPGGYTPGQLRPLPAGDNQDVSIILVGDEGLVECTPVNYNFDKAFRYSIVARKRRLPGG